MPLTIGGERIPQPSQLEALAYGSCVSRDLIELFNDEVTCVDYIARQSWISASSDGVEGETEIDLRSSFQRRMVLGDLRSSAREAFDEHAVDSDFIVMDIVDDRFGVYPVGAGFITPSAEFSASGLRNILRLGDHIPFGTPEHLSLWKEAAHTIGTITEPYADKTFLLGATFTENAVDGVEVPPALGRSAAEWNAAYQPYYEAARSAGLRVLDLPETFAYSTSHHTWGPAPFHYVEQAYRWWYDQICTVLASNAH